MKLLLNRKIITSMSLALAITSCSATGKKLHLKNVETRTYISNQCLISSNDTGGDRGVAAIVASTLIPMAINWVIDQFTEKLTEIKKVEKKSSTEFYLYKYEAGNKYPQWNEDFGCVTSITGVFDKESIESSIVDDVDRNTTKVTLSDKNTRDESIIARLKDNEIEVKDVFSIYESKLEFAKDASAFKFVSQFLDVKKLLSRKNSTELVYSYEIVGPGSTPDSKMYASAVFNFGTTKPNTVHTPGDFKKAKETGWIRKVGMSRESLLSFLSQHNLSDGAKKKSYTPIKFKVANTQTNNPSDGAKLVAAILGKAKETIGSEAVKALVPEDKKEKENKILDAQIAHATTKVAIVEADAESDEHKALAALQEKKACKALKELDPNVICG